MQITPDITSYILEIIEKVYIEKFQFQTEKENLKLSRSAEKLKSGDPLAFLKLQFALLQNVKKFEKGPFGEKKNSKKFAQCQKNSKILVRWCMLR